MFGKKIVTPLLVRQLKNNQNQTNTTGAQNLKEVNNTAGWLSVFFVFFFVMINQVESPSNHPSPSPADLKIKKTNAVIW